MITTNYMCDRCGKYGPEMGIFLVEIRVHTGSKGQRDFCSYSTDLPGYVRNRAQWCRGCLAETKACTHAQAIRWGHAKKKTKDPGPPSVEDMIREIVSEEIDSR